MKIKVISKIGLFDTEVSKACRDYGTYIEVFLKIIFKYFIYF